uniref:Uncharacterized protein n=1 Tax=Sphaerodactylus townsendi TaxID=933632 RepID=A0ACB8E7V8_9SAUR
MSRIRAGKIQPPPSSLVHYSDVIPNVDFSHTRAILVLPRHPPIMHCEYINILSFSMETTVCCYIPTGKLFLLPLVCNFNLERKQIQLFGVQIRKAYLGVAFIQKFLHKM